MYGYKYRLNMTDTCPSRALKPPEQERVARRSRSRDARRVFVHRVVVCERFRPFESGRDLFPRRTSQRTSVRAVDQVELPADRRTQGRPQAHTHAEPPRQQYGLHHGGSTHTTFLLHISLCDIFSRDTFSFRVHSPKKFASHLMPSPMMLGLLCAA